MIYRAKKHLPLVKLFTVNNNYLLLIKLFSLIIIIYRNKSLYR